MNREPMDVKRIAKLGGVIIKGRLVNRPKKAQFKKNWNAEKPELKQLSDSKRTCLGKI
jgi:hypothetical protein